MFGSVPHQTLAEEFEQLFEKQLTCDPTLVISSLESRNCLGKVGGKEYIEQLLAKDIDPTGFTEFIELVIAGYKARSFIALTSGIDKRKITPANIDEYIRETKVSLDNLGGVKGDYGATHISDLTKDVYDTIISRRSNPGIRGSSWGNRDIDATTGGKCGGDLWVIGGRPGQGKTTAIINSMLEDGKNGIPSLLIEREMRNQELVERLISLDTGITNTKIRLGLITPDESERIKESLLKLKTYPIYMDSNYHASDPHYVESTVIKFKNKHGIEVVYLDYIQLLAERDEGQTQQIGRFTRLFKLLSNDLNICSVILSQLNRNVEARDNKRPLLSDLRQSGSLEEDADFVIGLYRDEYYYPETKFKNLLEFIVLKNRNGPQGTITTAWDGSTYKIGVR